MPDNRNIDVRLTVRDDGTVVLKRFGKQVDRTAARSERSFKRLNNAGQRTSRIVRDLATSFGLLGGAVGVAAFILPLTQAVRVTNQLDVALAGVKAVSGATASEMAALEAQARHLGETTQYSAAQAAGAQEYLARAGFKVNQILAATPATLDLAAAGNLDLARSADLASNVLQGFQKDASELGNVVDIMAATTANANTDVEQMGEAMSYVAPVAHSFGVSIKETAAGIAVLSNAGLQGQRAGTGLRRVLVELANPSNQLREAMGGLSLQSDGLVAVLKQLQKSTLTASQAMDIFGQRGGPAFNLLREGAVSADDFAKALDDVQNYAHKVAATKLDNLSGDARKLGSALAELGIKIGRSGLLQSLRALTQSLTAMARSDTAAAIAHHLVPVLSETLGLVTALAAARFGGPALAGLGVQAVATAGSFQVFSRRLLTARGRMVAAARAARALNGAVGLVGGPAGLAILAAYGVYRLVTRENDLEKASKAAARAQKQLNEEMDSLKGASQDAVIAAVKAQEDLVQAMEQQLTLPNHTLEQSLKSLPATMSEPLRKARDRLAELKHQLQVTQPALDAFGGAGPKIEAALGGAAHGAEEAATALDRLKEATKRLNAREDRALSDARAFASAQQKILQAQFEAKAPTLTEDQRVKEQARVNEKIAQLQDDLATEELRIARKTASERTYLLHGLVSDKQQIAKGELAIAQDEATEELAIERRKRAAIEQQLLQSLDKEKRLRQQSVNAFNIADQIEQKARDAGKTTQQLIREAALKALSESGQKAIETWQKYVNLGGDAYTAARHIREEAKKLADRADDAGKKTKTLAQQFQDVQTQIAKAEEKLRKLTEDRDLKTTVKVDDSAFQAFLQKLATPGEYTVNVKAAQQKSTGGPVVRRAAGGWVPGGYGGGDRVRALLEPGEWVIRKEAVRKYGAAMMSALNGMRLDPPPILRRAGGPVGDPASAGTGRDIVNVHLNLGGQTIPLFGEREMAQALVRSLKGLQSSVAGGV